ncbi:MAG TPA: iron-containing alcohol dehydrogenase [Vicinamibacteria bacterium]|nr:iron-containing alcohol dehydrogenase [Vicinamibacteria bacterium]
MLSAFEYKTQPQLVFGRGCIARLGEIARELGFQRALFVADPGVMATPHARRALESLRKAGISLVTFTDFQENPDTEMVERGRIVAAREKVDSLIGFGGGSSMDCAKAISLLVTNGGRMSDYRGYGIAKNPLFPMIGIPTTAGTGSEGQSYALISDAVTHVKMACGVPTAAFRVALLDPELTVTQPPDVTATAGYDALSHAVETYVTTRRNALSDMFSREAFRLLARHYTRVLSHPDDLEARAAMQLGAHYAGVAIENSMLGATHACANPLTQHYGAVHGRAIAVCLPSVVRFNKDLVDARYRELMEVAGRDGSGEALASLLEELASVAGLPTRLGHVGVGDDAIADLAKDAAEQWTGRFNPRPFDEEAAREIYRWAS